MLNKEKKAQPTSKSGNDAKPIVKRRALYILFVLSPFIYLPGALLLSFGTVAWWGCIGLIVIDFFNRYYLFVRHGD